MEKNLPMGLSLSVLLTYRQLSDSIKDKITYFEIYSLLLVYQAVSKLLRKIFYYISYSGTLNFNLVLIHEVKGTDQN